MIDMPAHRSARERTDPHAPLIDACADARGFSSSLASPVLQKPDQEGHDHSPGTEPKPKTMAMWKTELHEPGAWPYIEKGLASWPKTGPLAAAGFGQLDAAKLLHTAWVKRKDSNPIDMINDADAQLDAWMCKRKKRRTQAEIRVEARRLFRLKAANTIEQDAKQQKRIDAHGRELDAQEKAANDDPLTEWEAAPWKKDAAEARKRENPTND